MTKASGFNGCSLEAAPVRVVLRRDERLADVELDLRVRAERDIARVPGPDRAVVERGHLPLRRPGLRRRERLVPDVEEVAERECPVHRRLDVDDPVGRVRVEPGEAGAMADEGDSEPWLELRVCDP